MEVFADSEVVVGASVVVTCVGDDVSFVIDVVIVGASVVDVYRGVSVEDPVVVIGLGVVGVADGIGGIGVE